MARLEITGLDELAREMAQRGENVGAAADAMILAASNVTNEAWKEEAEKRKFWDTHDMIDSIGFRVQKNSDPKKSEVYAIGKDRRGVRNTEKAFILHYGRNKQSATHWIDDAVASAGPKVNTTMQSIWNEYIQTGNVRTIKPAKRITRKAR